MYLSFQKFHDIFRTIKSILLIYKIPNQFPRMGIKKEELFMKKAMVLMGLVLAAAVIVPSAVPAKQADILVGPSLTDIPVGPATAYIVRGLTDDTPAGPSLTDIPVAPTEVAYMARGKNAEQRELIKSILLKLLGHDKGSDIIVIG